MRGRFGMRQNRNLAFSRGISTDAKSRKREISLLTSANPVSRQIISGSASDERRRKISRPNLGFGGFARRHFGPVANTEDKNGRIAR